MDWLLRVDVAVLGMMLACTLMLVVRVSRYYRLALHGGVDTIDGKGVVAELKAHVRNLKSIACTATYLGLLGTCSGILTALSSGGGERNAYARWFASTMAAALVPCASAIVVAVPATCGYMYGCTRLELLGNGLRSRNRLLTRHFTEFASFGLIAAWLLAILIRVFFVPFTPVPTYEGFDVGIASVPCNNSDTSIVLRLSKRGGIFVNEEEQDWRSLQSRLSEIYRMRAYSIVYVSADEGVRFQTVADAIDAAKSENITVRLVTPRAINADCSDPRLVGGSARHPSK